MLSHSDMTPLYQQIKEKLRESILKDELKPGEKIQTEQELIAGYNVSRITVRNAIAALVDEGYLIKKQGKGTFVNNRKRMEREIITFLSFTQACRAKGVRASSLMIRREVLEPTAEDRVELELSDNDRVICIQRVRYGDEEPIMIETNRFSLEKFAYLLDEDLEGSLYELLSGKYGVDPSRSHSTIEISRAGEFETDYLKVPVDTPLFLIVATAYDSENQPVHRSEQLIVAERYKISYSNGF